MKELLALIICLIVFGKSGLAQNSNKIVPVYKSFIEACKSCETLVSLTVVDKTSNRIIKKIDILELNPYNHLAAKKISVKEGLNIFDLSQKSETFEKRFKSRMSEDAYNSIERNGGFHQLYSNEHTSDYIAIRFVGSFHQLNEDISTSFSSIIIFDSNGNIVNKILDVQDIAHDITITPDGKYLSYYYEEPRQGFVIYNLEKNEISTDYQLYETINTMYIGDSLECIYFAGRHKHAMFFHKTNTLYIDEKSGSYRTTATVDIKEDGIYDRRNNTLKSYECFSEVIYVK